MQNQAKTFLMQYRKHVAMLKNLHKDIEQMRESLTSITAPLMDDPVQTSGNHDKMAATIAKIVDAETEYAEFLLRTHEQRLLTIKAIESVPDAMQRAALTLRYIEGLDWASVADRMDYQIGYTYIIHRNALVAVNKWLQDNDHEHL